MPQKQPPARIAVSVAIVPPSIRSPNQSIGNRDCSKCHTSVAGFRAYCRPARSELSSMPAMKATFLLAFGVAAGFLRSASAQELAGEEFASYALDFCVAIADGQDPDLASRMVLTPATLLGPEPAGDDNVDFVGPDLEASRDTLLFVLGSSDTSKPGAMAFARADGTHCVAFGAEGQDSLDALRRRLARAGMTWQPQMAISGLEIFKRNASNGTGSIELSVVPERRNNV